MNDPVKILAMTCRLKNRRVIVGRLPDGGVHLKFKRLRTARDPAEPRVVVTTLNVSAEAMGAMLHAYSALCQREDAEHAKKMPTTYTVDVTAVTDPPTWTADHERGIG